MLRSKQQDKSLHALADQIAAELTAAALCCPALMAIVISVGSSMGKGGALILCELCAQVRESNVR